MRQLEFRALKKLRIVADEQKINSGPCSDDGSSATTAEAS